MSQSIKIGTRGSQLALYQAYKTKEVLEQLIPDIQVEIKIIKTKGDKILDTALSKIGDKGLFTKEIEVDLINGGVDIAVHSLKDLPTQLPEGLKLGGVLERGEYRDAIVSLNGKTLHSLKKGDVVATSSLRRRAQLLKLNPEIKVIDIRGNVNTRIKKLEENYCDATIMAAAGLQRLEMERYISEILPAEKFMPAVCQGIIGLEIRDNDEVVENIIKKINHKKTWLIAMAERKFLSILEGGCQVPIACYTNQIENRFEVYGSVAMPDGTSYIYEEKSGEIENAVELAAEVADNLLKKGAYGILQKIKML